MANTYYYQDESGSWLQFTGSKVPKGAVGGVYEYEDTPMAKAEAKRNALIQEYQTAYDEAKTANEERYQEILTGYDTRYSDTMSALSGLSDEVLATLANYGEATLDDIRNTYNQQYASNAQSLINSGLHSTTIAPTVQNQTAKQEAAALALAQDTIANTKANYQTTLGSQEIAYGADLSEDKLNFMERREDEYPSESLYVSLLNQLGNSGY